MNFQSVGSAPRFESEVGRAVVRTGLIPVIAMNVRGYVVHWTAAAEQMFGYSEAEAVGRELAELIVPARLRALHRAGLHRYLFQASPAVLRTRIETQGLRADGTEFPADVAIIRDDSGEEPLIIGMVRDVTKRREAEERLERTVSLLAEAEELAGVGSFDRNLRIALDDFGTGFGSFYHLKHLPVDFLKIDREFIEDLTHSDIDQRLVRSIADVAGGLGISTVAEAVGDQRTIELLAEFGVDYVQGLYIGTPVPVELKD